MKLTCLFYFRVIVFGVHSQYNCIKIIGYRIRVPAHFLGQQTFVLAGWCGSGSNTSSSEPETLYPFLFRAIANWCITLPPIDMKCTFINFSIFEILTAK